MCMVGSSCIEGIYRSHHDKKKMVHHPCVVEKKFLGIFYFSFVWNGKHFPPENIRCL
ncbi:hypothetical protein Hanom_Chr11g01049771 [Helianthus anomalus]